MPIPSERHLATSRVRRPGSHDDLLERATWRLMAVPLLGLLALLAIVVLAGG